MTGRQRSHGASGALPVAVFLALTVMTWRRTGDPLVDWGRELYTAWRLAEGDLLYVDVASLFGPLSQYLNAAWFTVLGPGHVVLAVINLSLIAGTGWLIHDLVLRLADRGTARVAVLVFFTLFAFGHLTLLGNYNFITPYAHEATHGTILCLVMLWGVVRLSLSGSRRAAWIVGLACGATWLTKPEIALASTVALGTTGFFLSRHTVARPVLPLVVAGVLAPPAVAWMAFAAATSPGRAVGHVAFPFTAVAAVDPLAQEFYVASMGLDEPWVNVASMVAWTAGTALAVALIVAADRRLPATRWIPAAVAVVGIALAPWLPVLQLARVLPLLTVGAAVSFFLTLVRRPARDAAGYARQVGLLALAVLALMFLAKLGLRPRLHHYGFYLALPATLLAVTLAVHSLPRWSATGGGTGILVRRIGVVCLALLMLGGWARSYARVQDRTHELATGRDRLLARSPAVDPRTATVERVLGRLETRPETERVAIVPEGAMLAYWLRRELAVPYPVLLPPEVRTYGDTALLASFRSGRPDVIVRIDRDWAEYIPDGVAGIVPGAPELSAWLDLEYCPARAVSQLSDTGDRHRVEVLVPRAGADCESPESSSAP